MTDNPYISLPTAHKEEMDADTQVHQVNEVGT